MLIQSFSSVLSQHSGWGKYKQCGDAYCHEWRGARSTNIVFAVVMLTVMRGEMARRVRIFYHDHSIRYTWLIKSNCLPAVRA